MSGDRGSHFLRGNLFDLTGKVALVTGGGSGIGLMITQTLAWNGAKVYIVGRTASKLERVVETYNTRDLPGRIVALPGDVSSKEGVRALHASFVAHEEEETKAGGKGAKQPAAALDVLVNNAGVASAKVETDANASAEDVRRSLFEAEQSTFDDWNGTYSTNVTSGFFVTAAFAPQLQRAGEREKGWSAAVVNVSSVSGLIKHSQRHFAYNASKAAAVYLTRMLAAEIAGGGGEKKGVGVRETEGGGEGGGGDGDGDGDGDAKGSVKESRLKIRVNGIAPGVFPSEMTAGESGGDQKSELDRGHFARSHAEDVPAGRPGEERDMAQAVLFVVGCTYLSGQTVVVDGGYTLGAGM
ncbi:short chain dehydrogenase reductase family protein [Purpureocillium lilacinum]|uniref:Short chain dehydrogenase reductase family protein n=1 Tax=Purpureocillium lilacinum TaxID=33203 RepID=A0A179FJC8_PURLI|nr:short chain dehydrogenase reductase family protein [Purpureocillium lilacinum]OAQ65686.1 short chain dehydrogenase reductase family protein [Purpureocillium lilacinum]